MTVRSPVRTAVITNITPNHLNWHTDMEEYAGAKAKILNGCGRAVLNYGNTLTVGNDVILQRFMGAIYQSVPGIGYITVEASTDGNTYTTNNISIDARHVATFDSTRIQVTIV